MPQRDGPARKQHLSSSRLRLEAITAPAKEQVKDHYEQNQAQSTTPVVTDSWPHVEATAAEQEDQDH